MGCCGSTLDPYALAVPILPDNTGQTSKYPLAGKPPARANVAFRFKVKVPKHILYNNMMKRKDAKDADDMKVPGVVVHEEGAPGSPWAAMSDGMYGELAPHFNVRAPLSIHRSLPTRHPPPVPLTSRTASRRRSSAGTRKRHTCTPGGAPSRRNQS